MATGIKISSLNPIGANITHTSLLPVVNMAGTPTTEKATAQVLGNLILSGAGGSYFPAASQAVLAQSVTNAAQPNITSVGTLTSLNVSGNISAGSFSGDGSLLTNVSVDLTGYATETYVNNAISNIDLSSYATQTYVNDAISNIDLSSYATQTYVNNAIANVTVDLTGYATETFVNTQIDTQTLKLSTDIYQDVTSTGVISFYTLNPNEGYGPGLNYIKSANFSDSGLSNVLWNSTDITSSGLSITTDWNGGSAYGKMQWSFNRDGNLIFPDGTKQTTAYTGGGASYNQSLNTTDNVSFANLNIPSGGFIMTDMVEDYAGAGLTLRGWTNTSADYVFNGKDGTGAAEILLPSRTYIRNVTGDGGGFVDIESYNAITNKTDDSFSQGATYLEPYSFVVDIDHVGTTGPRSTWRFDTDGITFPDGYIQTTAYRRNENVLFQNYGGGADTLDCTNTTIFRRANVTSNITANLTNLKFENANSTLNRALTVSIIIAQGATPYVCNAIQIEGVSQTILWQGSTTAPTGNANKTDIITFSIIRTGLGTTDYIVFGQLVSFG